MTAPHFVRPDHHELPTGTRHDGAGHDGSSLNRRPKQSTAPAGLWAPAPEVPREEVAAKAANKPRPPRKPKPRKPRDLAPCGTEAAYRRHLAYKTETCEPCRRAHAEFKRGRPPRATRKQYVRPNCGTEAGYQAHRSHKERICDDCRTAHNGRQHERRRARAASEGRELQPRQAVALCGTASGYKKHRRIGEQACAECLAAKRTADRQYTAEKRVRRAA